ncbi:sensor histidine kinase [Marinobacter caseinilyticus]|uniref:sensor histidine kinase n=1 Tax=Marinobacter caseinilyticus TaxID=2692195 RepID=UPI00140CD255|nr:HAMP domain-containing sensor histidine kinase [Marinobacter caseinilyticus]
MRKSLSARLYRVIFGVSLATVFLSLMAVEFQYSDLESTILDIELEQEQKFFRNQISNPHFQHWETARLKAFFLGAGASDQRLPALLQDLPEQYSEEVELGDKTYLVLVEPVSRPAGRLYLAQDISLMESRELYSQIAIVVIALLITLIGFVLSQLSARKLIQPLRRLTHQIQNTAPSKNMDRLSLNYTESEYADIASAFNRFLDALEVFVAREKAFVKMASHELRTPLAVISGALDVIEQRSTLSSTDQRTAARIRRATSDMQSDVEVLLTLARGGNETQANRLVSLGTSTSAAIQELDGSQPNQAGRVTLLPSDHDLTLRTDPALVRMLLRNLIQNALKHTRSEVHLALTHNGVRITDFGSGLPSKVVHHLTMPNSQHTRPSQESSFGLLIVQLICERMAWHLTVVQSDHTGTVLEVDFRSPAPGL